MPSSLRSFSVPLLGAALLGVSSCVTGDYELVSTQQFLDSACGNGTVEDFSFAEGEACDDGNRTSGDGCSAVCQVERGYACEGEPSECEETTSDDSVDDDVPQGFADDDTSGNDDTDATDDDATADDTGSGGAESEPDVSEPEPSASETEPTPSPSPDDDVDDEPEPLPEPETLPDTTSEGPSCTSLGNDCAGTSCCAHRAVMGGTFQMGSEDEQADVDEQPEHPVTVSSFYLDLFEVTVGRYRAFINADPGPPAPGAGAHPKIANSGWQAAWDGNESWDGDEDILAGLETYCAHDETGSETWNAEDDALPVDCATWYHAFAFCIWDGGRLPTEAEWEYAAAGGDLNRKYPWGDGIELGTHVAAISTIEPVGSFAEGAGIFGQFDMAGNQSEWVLDLYAEDWYGGAGNTCVNCSNLSDGGTRVIRGGANFNSEEHLRAAARNHLNAASRQSAFRCARDP